MLEMIREDTLQALPHAQKEEATGQRERSVHASGTVKCDPSFRRIARRLRR